MLIGTAFRGAREALGVTQATVAARAGLTQKTVDNLESGDVRISTAVRLNQALYDLALERKLHAEAILNAREPCGMPA